MTSIIRSYREIPEYISQRALIGTGSKTFTILLSEFDDVKFEYRGGNLMKSKMTIKDWMTLIAVCAAGGTIFKLAYIWETYSVQLQETLNVPFGQMGFMMTAFAFTQFFSYLPGGWLVDFISIKILVPLSLLITGLAGLYYATMPPFIHLLVIQGIFGITTTLLFWEAMIKAVRLIGDKSGHGKGFGFLEGGRGVFGTIFSFLSLYAFTKAGEGAGGMKAAILTYSIILIALGIITFFLIEKNEAEGNLSPKESLQGLVKVIKTKEIWLCGLVIFFGYSAYNGLSFFSPYIKNIFGMSDSLTVGIGIVRQYGIAIFMAPIGGIIADRMGSSLKFLRASLLSAIIVVGIIMLVPANPAYSIVVSVLMLVLAGVFMTIRGTYFAPIAEAGFPAALTGSAAGAASLIGYLPDFFISSYYGNFIDKYPGSTGYVYIFISIIVFAVMGIACAMILSKMLKGKTVKFKKEAEVL
jgi:nitrate/nitrite transporter NarK